MKSFTDFGFRCWKHSRSSQINISDGRECGECIRQQCWEDMLGLLDKITPSIPEEVSGREAITMLRATLTADGIGTFGMSDEVEAALAKEAQA
jgi:hypothetical protein